MRQGYQILWPELDRSPYDFVIETESGFERVQVKKAFWNKHAGTNQYLQCRCRDDEPDHFDRLIAVDEDGRIIDIPWPEYAAHSCLMLEKKGPTCRYSEEGKRAELWRIN
jgi:hypothetical protein